MSDHAPKTLLLKQIPHDVMEIIWDKQNEMKKISGRVVPLEKVFCRIVRESINKEKK